VHGHTQGQGTQRAVISPCVKRTTHFQVLCRADVCYVCLACGSRIAVGRRAQLLLLLFREIRSVRRLCLARLGVHTLCAQCSRARGGQVHGSHKQTPENLGCRGLYGPLVGPVGDSFYRSAPATQLSVLPPWLTVSVVAHHLTLAPLPMVNHQKARRSASPLGKETPATPAAACRTMAC